MTSILLADDHTMFRDALHKMLTDEPGFEIVGHVDNGIDLVVVASANVPDVACVDVNMPKLNGIEATRMLLAVNPAIRVIGVSASVERTHVIDMLNAGAVGYVSKSSAATELLLAIRTVLRGNTYLCPNAASVVVEMVRDDNSPARSPTSCLGARERQVLKLLADGLKPSQIAARLLITTGTVDVHRRNIMRKLELQCTADLVKFAIRNGLTSAEL
jgi:two-component system NarL family response regulator